MVGTTSSMVKIVKQEFKVNDTMPQCFDVLASFICIELSYSSSSEDLTPLPSSAKLSKCIL
jgi:hypothetical protein